MDLSLASAQAEQREAVGVPGERRQKQPLAKVGWPWAETPWDLGSIFRWNITSWPQPLGQLFGASVSPYAQASRLAQLISTSCQPCWVWG